MSSLPTRTDISGTPSNATAKSALTSIYDFVAQRFARGTTGAGTPTDAELLSARDSLGVPVVNWLHNPDGAIVQLGLGARADDAYMDDRWYALTQTATITPSQVSSPEDGYRFGLRLTQSQAAAQRMGRAQIIEGKDAQMLRGKSVTFGGRVKLSTSANVRMAILAWTGTEDSVTSDVVLDWTSASYTAGGFFINTTTTVVATSSTAMTAATAGDVSVSGTIPSTATNIIVFYWTEATAAQNVTLDAWGLRLVEATRLVDHIRRSIGQELVLCQRFVEKSFRQGTAPQTGLGTTEGAAHIFIAGKAGAAITAAGVKFAVTKWGDATVTLYNPTNANNEARDTTAGGDCSGTVVSGTGDSAFFISTTGNAATAVGNTLAVHWLAVKQL